MKYLLILIYSISFAQTITKNEIDDFTHQKEVIIELTNDSISNLDTMLKNKTELEYNSFGSTTLNISATKDKNQKITYKIYIKTYRDIGCFSQYTSKITILLNDSRQINLKQSTQTDCSSSPEAFFIISKANLLLLKNNINKIRIHGNQYYSDAIFDKKHQKILDNSIDMLIKTINQ